MDANDPLAKYRKQFHFPDFHEKEVIYFTGNSLGLQPKKARTMMNEEMDDWARYGVEGHFMSRRPWYAYHEFFSEKAARLVGARPDEVVMMNSLTTNLHLMMVSFYQPSGQRNKIICEGKAFPSDLYALESQVRFHNLDPDQTIIELHPREGEHSIRKEDVLATIAEHADELALVMIGGVNYYTGQVFDMEAITKAGHDAGAFVGFDLAHGAGNLHLKLHDWGPDFAVWCSYKYLNSGPGSISGAFVHERHHKNEELTRFAGWWGYDKTTRFEMKKGFRPIPSAEAWQLSNAPVFAMAPHLASLELFDEIGMEALRKKTRLLSGYLEFMIDELSEKAEGASFEIITPRDWKQRGCQLSVLAHGMGKNLFNYLNDHGAIVDWRDPNVIRMAPVPMYNSFTDVYRFGQILEGALKHLGKSTLAKEV